MVFPRCRGWGGELRFVGLFASFPVFSCSALGWRELQRGLPALTPQRVLASLLGGLSCPQASAPSRCAARSPGGHQSRRTRPSQAWHSGQTHSRRRLAPPEGFWEKPQPTWPVPEADLAPCCLPFSVGGRTGGPRGRRWGRLPWLPAWPGRLAQGRGFLLGETGRGRSGFLLWGPD